MLVFYPTELEELNWMRFPSNERSKVRRRKRMKKKKKKRKRKKRRKQKGLYGSADAGQEMT